MAAVNDWKWRPHPLLYLRKVLHDEWIGCIATWQQADLDAARAEAKVIYAELFNIHD